MAGDLKDQGSASSYRTHGNVAVTRTRQSADYRTAIDTMMDGLDERMGAVLSSNYEYPGRYTRWIERRATT